MKKLAILTVLLVLLGATFTVSIYAAPFALASTTEEEEEETAPPPPAPPVTPPTSLTTTTTATAPPTTPAQDIVRARLMLFGVPQNSPDIIAWVSVPAQNATSVDTITAAALDATNNVTGDGIGEVFISLPNATAQVNQQVDACALDVVNKLPVCDNAFQATTNSSTMLQILMGGGQPGAAAAATALPPQPQTAVPAPAQ